MNRQIKFRGHSLDREGWLYGDLARRTYPNEDGTTETWYYINPSDRAEEVRRHKENMFSSAVNSSTIGQFTGLYDRENTPIYEGDILRFPPKDKWEETSFVGYEVFWHDNDCCERHIGFQMNRHHFYGYVCGTGDFRDFVPKTTKQMIVIGNIHDDKIKEE